MRRLSACTKGVIHVSCLRMVLASGLLPLQESGFHRMWNKDRSAVLAMRDGDVPLEGYIFTVPAAMEIVSTIGG